MAGTAGEYGLALLPGSRTGRRTGAGGFHQGLAGTGELAARRKLLYLAVCAGGECVSIGAEAVSDGDGANGGDCGAIEALERSTRIWTEQMSSEAVRRAVLALPVRYREPVVLYYFHEMDLGGAARTMGVPEGTMKARLSRARELLRRRFPGLKAELDSHPLQGADRMGHPGSPTVLESHPSDKDKNVAKMGRGTELESHPSQTARRMGHPASSGEELLQDLGKEA